MKSQTRICLDLVQVSPIGKSSAGKIKCKQFHWALVHHLQTVTRLRAFQLAEKNLSYQVLCCVRQNANWIIFVLVVIRNQTADFLEVHKEFSIAFPLCKNGTCVLGKGGTVIIPYLCTRANSTIRAPFRWISMNRFWLWTGLSSFGVSPTLNSLFIPMSILCLAKMPC